MQPWLFWKVSCSIRLNGSVYVVGELWPYTSVSFTYYKETLNSPSTFGPLYSTWSHKNTYLCALSVRHRFTYRTARFAAVSKRNVHWVSLKHRLNTWPPASFYYVDIAVFLLCFYRYVLRRFRIQISGVYRYKLMLYHALHQTQPYPDSVNICNTDIKTYLLMQPCHVNFLMCRFELFCRTVITQDLNRSSSPLKYVSVLRELPNKLTVYENP